MAFVRHKKVKGHKYYQLVRNYREQGKHCQEVLWHLGLHDSLEEAILAEKRKLDPISAGETYWLDRANEELQNAKRHYHLHGQGVELLDASDAHRRWQELHEQYEAAQHLPDRENAWDRVYGSRGAEVILIRCSLGYHWAKDKAEYYREWYEEERQARLDRMLELMDKYPQPMRSPVTLDLLERWRDKYA